MNFFQNRILDLLLIFEMSVLFTGYEIPVHPPLSMRYLVWCINND